MIAGFCKNLIASNFSYNAQFSGIEITQKIIYFKSCRKHKQYRRRIKAFTLIDIFVTDKLRITSQSTTQIHLKIESIVKFIKRLENNNSVTKSLSDLIK